MALDNSVYKTPDDVIRAATLRGINHFLAEPGLPVYRDLKRMCERVSDSYRDRVVLELLQNAHDAHDSDACDGRIKLRLDERDGPFGTLIVANDGRGFTPEDVEALCSPAKTTKTVNEAIGNKGVGFLSVFQVSANPEIYSRSNRTSPDMDGFCFRFGERADLQELLRQDCREQDTDFVVDNMPRLYLACPIGDFPPSVKELAAQGYATVVRLRLKNDDARESIARQLNDLLQDRAPVQLFLSRVAELRVSRSSSEDVRLTRSSSTLEERDGFSLLRVECGAAAFLVARQAVPERLLLDVIDRDVSAERLPEAWCDWKGDGFISLAVSAEGPPLKGRLYNFLPMGEQAASPLAGHLDAPFFASIDRLSLQSNVELNTVLLEACRKLALDAALALKRCLPEWPAQIAVADMLFWTGEGRKEIREALVASNEEIIPAVRRSGSNPWASLNAVRTWIGDDFIDADFAARVTDIPLVQVSIGDLRLALLGQFASGSDLLDLTIEQRADIIENVAEDLLARRSATSEWDRFYQSIAALFQDDADSLVGRKILYTGPGQLLPAEGRAERGRPERSRRRTTATFFPSIRTVDEQDAATNDFPTVARLYVACLDSDLECCRERTSSARRFLTSNRLVREYETREILRLLASALSAADDEDERVNALTAIMRMVCDEDVAAAAVADLKVIVPSRQGWIPAEEALFGRFPQTTGDELEDFLERTAGISKELEEQRDKLLAPLSDWAIPDDSERWVSFLRKAGVIDHLRPISAFEGPSPRAWGRDIADHVTQRALLTPALRVAWRALLKAKASEPPNPYTNYSARDVYRIPGQSDFERLAATAGKQFAVQIIRMLGAQPSLLEMTVFRPDHFAGHPRTWPSPIAAFLSTAHWVPVVSGRLVPLHQAWLLGSSNPLIPRLPIVDHDIRKLLARTATAETALKPYGLPEYGSKLSAWALLDQLSHLVETATPAEAERYLVATQEAWNSAPLDQDLPTGFKLVGRIAGRVCALPAMETERSILLADGEDRRMLTAIARVEPDTFIFEPPLAEAGPVAQFLQEQLAPGVRRISEIEAHYEVNGQPFAFDPLDPSATTELGQAILDLAALTLRYRCRFHRKGHTEALQRLSAVRLRWIDRLELRIGGLLAAMPPQPSLATTENGKTILAPETLRTSPIRLVALAETLGEAMGSRKNIGEPLLAVAALVGDRSLTHETLSEVFDVPTAEIKSAISDARVSGAQLAFLARPFLTMWAGESAAEFLAPGSDIVTEEELAKLIDGYSSFLPIPGSRLTQLCRETGDIEALALALDVDLARLNATIATLGAPYQKIDRTAKHESDLRDFLQRRSAEIRETLRSSHRAAFDAGASLAAYVAAREAPAPALPANAGTAIMRLTQDQMGSLLRERFVELDAPMSEGGTFDIGIDETREANIRKCRQLVPQARVLVLAKDAIGVTHGIRWARIDEAEADIIREARSQGWIDFDVLDTAAMLRWWSRAGIWPDGWPCSLALKDHGVGEQQAARIEEADKDRNASAARERKLIRWSGGEFVAAQISYGDLADQIALKVQKNAALLSTTARSLHGDNTGRTPKPSSHRGAGGGAGGGFAPTRMSDEEKAVVGLFGETIAFAWLKSQFGRRRIIDEACWKSMYRTRVFGGEGNDLLGYDFEVHSGKASWYFEVKATSSADIRHTHLVELGSTEIAWAEACRADRQRHYRILYVVDALSPEQAQMFVLPNPRSDRGQRFYLAQKSSGVRLTFPMIS